LAALACAAPAAAQTGRVPDTDRIVPSDANALKASFSPVVRRTAPAVVNVLTVRQRARDPWFELFGGESPQREAARGGQFQPTGSGVIVRPEGIIVTNNHVVEGASSVRVTLSDRREFDAQVLLRDPRADLAILKINAGADRLPYLNVDVMEQPEVGDLVLAIGNPFGVGQTVTSGIVSATNRAGGGATGASFIQTDAPINPGNSGGPLVDMDGDVIGINTAILSRSGTYSGVGFAVPAQLVRQVVETAAGGATRVVRPYLGVSSRAVTTEVAQSMGLARPAGVLIGGVTPNSPAARAGLRQGDIVLSARGVPVNEPSELTFQIVSSRPGDAFDLQVRRDGRVETIRARLEAPPEVPREQRTLAGPHPMAGATVANLSTDILDRVGADPLNVIEGVLVADPGRAYAARAGFRSGDIIREVNGRTVNNVRELEEAMNTARAWRITVRRGGQDRVAEFSA
jgi:Do/DeqQ family serine protease